MLADPTRTTPPRPGPPSALAARLAQGPQKPAEEGEEEACPAFGFLRGLRDRALMIEFRLRNGNTESFPYSWLGPVRFNPSAGLLLRFTGDTVTVVLIRGSNLDAVVGAGSVNLTDHGIHRHRITFIREMDAAEARKVEAGPTVDRITIVDFEAPHEIPAWLLKHAPEFARGASATAGVSIDGAQHMP